MDGDGRRVFYISGSGTLSVTISGVTLTNGDPDVDSEDVVGGGAIYNEENLSLIDCVVNGNFAQDGGAIMLSSGSLTLTRTTLSNNKAQNSGGGIWSYGPAVTIIDSTITGNQAQERGGGVYNYVGGALTISGTTISNNTAVSGAGAGIFKSGGSMSMTASTVSGNMASGRGGGIYLNIGSTTSTISQSTISGNSSNSAGGGIFKAGGGITIDNSTISGNDAQTNGGGIGLFYDGSLTLTSSTVSGNNADSQGGGIHIPSGVTATVTSSTISGNHAVSRGGGIYSAASNNDVTFNHSTIAFNTSPSGASTGVGFRSANRAILNHTIISNNLRGTSPDDVNGTFTANFSLIGNAGSASITNNTSIVGTTQANLAPLTDNGGRTKTHALLTGSVAIDAGNASIVGAPSFDQRGSGFPRILDGNSDATARIDIGAFERSLPQNLVVDIATDENDSNYAVGDLSLREALAIANSNSGISDTIAFHASLAGQTINLTMGQLSITDAVTINGLGANSLTVDASGNDSTPNMNEGNGSRVFAIDPGSVAVGMAVSISGLKLTGGDVSGEGGAILLADDNLTLTNVIVTANAAVSGGAVSVGAGSLQIVTSTVRDNKASSLGGGVRVSNGSLTVTDSTLSDNSAATGGGIWSDTDLVTKATTITNSTISGNTAIAAGGGVFNADGLTVIKHGTIANNTAANNSGSGVASTGNSTTRTEVSTTIISGNTNSDLDLVGGATNSFQSNGLNLVGSTAASTAEFVETGDIINSSPLLEALANNGGPAMTHLLMPGSPARNAGGIATPGSGGVPLFDQRGSGFSRVLGSQLDIGAVEMPAPVGPELPGDYNLDESVDAGDYVLWRKTFGLSVPQYEGADGDGDMTIGNGDYAVWTENFGDALSGSGGESLEALNAGGEIAAVTSGTAPLVPVIYDDRNERSAPFKTGARSVSPLSASNGHEDLLNLLDLVFIVADSETLETGLDKVSHSDSHVQADALEEVFAGLNAAI
jgi:hypothetical protein